MVLPLRSVLRSLMPADALKIRAAGFCCSTTAVATRGQPRCAPIRTWSAVAYPKSASRLPTSFTVTDDPSPGMRLRSMFSSLKKPFSIARKIGACSEPYTQSRRSETLSAAKAALAAPTRPTAVAPMTCTPLVGIFIAVHPLIAERLNVVEKLAIGRSQPFGGVDTHGKEGDERGDNHLRHQAEAGPGAEQRRKGDLGQDLRRDEEGIGQVADDLLIGDAERDQES